MPEPTARAVVSDDGSTIWLTAYTEAGDAVPVVLMPARAVALAGELIQAAVPKLGNVVEESSMTKGKNRGGDRQAEKRRQRDDDIRALARLTGGGKPLPQVAQDLMKRCERYQPMPEETSPDRVLLRRISDTGLPVPRKRRLIDILS
jgi:hypothetical protein